MHSLTQKELETLIKLESEGKLTPEDLYKRVALKTVQNKDNYVTSAIAHVVIGAVCVGLAGSVVAPVFLFFWGYSWFTSYKKRTESIRRINAGDFAEYLEPDDRTSYEQDTAVKTVETAAVSHAEIADAPGAVIGNDTKLGVMAVPAAAIPASTPEPAVPGEAPIATAATVERQMNAAIQEQTRHTDLALMMAKRLTSRIICAAPRTGKGLLIYKSLCHMKRLRPDVEIWALDIKAHASEDGYYSLFDADKVLRIDLTGFDKPPKADLRIQKFFHAFNQSTAQTKLIWVNEFVTLAAKLDPALWKLIQTFAVALCSAGSTGNEGQTGRFIWIDTQSPNVSDLGVRTRATRNGFRRIFLMNDDRSLLPSAVESGFALAIPDLDLEEFRGTGSTVSAYDSLTGEWVALPLWTPPTEAIAVAHSTPLKSEDALKEEEKLDSKTQRQRPNLSKAELGLAIAELSEWLDGNKSIDASDVYEKWKSRKHGFSRPEIRFLLTTIETL
jgi:hypothetical protein